MSLANAWIVPDCDTVLDWLAASSIAVDQQMRSMGRRRCWTCGAWHRSLCLLIEVGERWRRRRADSPPPSNQVPDQSSTGKPGWRSWSQHIVTQVASGAVTVSVWCGRAVVQWLSVMWQHQQSLLRQPCIHSVDPWKLVYLLHLSHHLTDTDWHPGSRCGWTCNQLTSKVHGGITGSRLRWSILS